VSYDLTDVREKFVIVHDTFHPIARGTTRQTVIFHVTELRDPAGDTVEFVLRGLTTVKAILTSNSE
jgi:hypothetical protein